MVMDVRAVLESEQRFWRQTIPIPEVGCCLWTGKVNPNGYGAMKVRGSQYGAHRIAWTITNGAIPDGMVVCHRCDTRLCVNPHHLFLGTMRDNMMDCIVKGRYNGAQWKRFYSDEQIKMAIDPRYSVLDVMRRIGMSETHIRRLRKGGL